MGLPTGILLILASVYASDGAVLQFLTAPSTIQLPSDGNPFASQVGEINSHLMGLSGKKAESWEGKGDLLRRPEALVVFAIDAPDHLKPELRAAKSYNLVADGSLGMSEVLESFQAAFEKSPITVLDVSSTIKGTHAEDLNVMMTNERVKTKSSPLREEISNMKAVEQWLRSGTSGVKNGAPDVYLFEVSGLLALSRTVGEDRNDLIGKARVELAQTIKELTEVLNSVYGGNALVELVTTGGLGVRAKRDAGTDGASDPDEKKLSDCLYKFTDPNYPVAFNIIFWTCLLLVLTILFVSVGMWFMDPGKDSIIYRMTMQRAKRD